MHAECWTDWNQGEQHLASDTIFPPIEKSFGFTLWKIYGDRLLDVHAWGSLGIDVIRQIMEETGYNVDDVNYCLCDVVRDHFTELYRTAGGATLMAHCARERRRIALDSLDAVMKRLSCISVEYEDVLPFSRVAEMVHSSPSAGQMEGLARELVNLSIDDAPGMDNVD